MLPLLTLKMTPGDAVKEVSSLEKVSCIEKANSKKLNLILQMREASYTTGNVNTKLAKKKIHCG